MEDKGPMGLLFQGMCMEFDKLTKRIDELEAKLLKALEELKSRERS